MGYYISFVRYHSGFSILSGQRFFINNTVLTATNSKNIHSVYLALSEGVSSDMGSNESTKHVKVL